MWSCILLKYVILISTLKPVHENSVLITAYIMLRAALMDTAEQSVMLS